MTQEVLRAFIDKNLTTRQIAQAQGVAQVTVTYWLRKHGLKTNHDRRGIPLDQNKRCRCTLCGESDPWEFYGPRLQEM